MDGAGDLAGPAAPAAGPVAEPVAAPAAAQGTSSARAVLAPVVLACLVRAIALTSAAGWSLGQEGGRHGGPPLVDGLDLGVTAALLSVLAVVTWAELALLQTRPRVGLVLSALWCACLLALGLVLTTQDDPFWLLPTAVFVVPTAAGVLRPASWRLPSRPVRRPALRRSLRLAAVHAAGVGAIVALWLPATLPDPTPAPEPALRWTATAAVVAVWGVLATARVRATLRGVTLPPSDLWVTTQVAAVVALSVLSWSVLS